MKINPRLGGAERIASAVVGVGLFAYALAGGIETTWLQVVLALLGGAFVVGGIGGT